MDSKAIVRTALLVASVLTALGVPLAAHHGWTGYDEKNPLTLTGTVKTSEYANPHGLVELDVNGKVWHVVLAPTSRMQDRGLTREMLKTGTKATVVGYANRQTSTELRAERITIGDKTIELR
jgi:Family of unknown function (DUF6152)